MVELKLYVSDVDYDSLLRVLADHIPGPAVAAAKMLPDSAKEELAVKYINANSERIGQMLVSGLAGQGVHLKISGAQAAVKQG